MTTSDPKTATQARARPSPARGDAGMPVLLLAALAAMLATVGAIWALAASSAVWAMVAAVVIALGGAVALIGLVDHQLADSNGTPRGEVQPR